MELNTLSILFIATTVLFMILAIYFVVLIRSKRVMGKTLDEQNQELASRIDDRNKKIVELNKKIADAEIKYKHLIELEKNESALRNSTNELTNKSKLLADEIERMKIDKDELSAEIQSIKEDISIFEPKLSLINLGFYEEPQYLYETSDRFKEEIKIVREKQKEMIKEKKCVEIPDSIAITTDTQYTRNILQGQTNLMIKAFNIECDNLISTVKSSNYASVLERIDKVATDIEKSALSLKCGFSKSYIELKFKECELQYQFKLKQEREKEEQDAIKERLREEQKAIKEYERALAKAEKEEEMYKSALDVARRELQLANEKDKQKLEDRILLLQKQLDEAEENHKRAQSMAEQTRRGHVYIISNIGSFGEDVYKIGLTRRLEPLERVKELGDASVPFEFDVHAMIYSEDAPKLESMLHNEFSRHRVNQVNLRKEFFNVNLLDIQNKAKELVEGDFEFKVTALAEEYYESLKLRAANSDN